MQKNIQQITNTVGSTKWSVDKQSLIVGIKRDFFVLIF